MQGRTWLAVAAGRLTGWVSRRLGHGGSTLPGKVALRIDPGLVGRLARRWPQGNVLISGTNGKTTTSALAEHILSAGGLRVGRNHAGANLISGLASAFLGWAGSRAPQLALLETDEATVPRAAREVRPRGLVVTNFFRDQLDRFGELSTAVRLVESGIPLLQGDGFVLLNADDPQVAYMARLAPPGVRVWHYGLEFPYEGGGAAYDAADARYCPLCGRPLDYRRRYYAHLGDYRCGCGWGRPPLDVAAAAWQPAAGQLTVRAGSGRWTVALRLPGIYNVYNLLAASTLALALGLDGAAVMNGAASFRPAFGRMEAIALEDGRTVWIALVKNPVGFNQVLGAIAEDPGGPKAALVVINDREADGCDVSWLWDVDLEHFLPRSGVQHWWVSGIRARDMAVRLKYAGVALDRMTVLEAPQEAAARALASLGRGEAATLYVLPTYTALLQVRGYFHQAGLVRHFRQG